MCISVNMTLGINILITLSCSTAVMRKNVHVEIQVGLLTQYTHTL